MARRHEQEAIETTVSEGIVPDAVVMPPEAVSAVTEADEDAPEDPKAPRPPIGRPKALQLCLGALSRLETDEERSKVVAALQHMV